MYEGRIIQPKLEPCPFCGGQAELTEKYNKYGGLMIFIECTACEAKTKAKAFRYDADFDDERTQSKYDFAAMELAERWNRRTYNLQTESERRAERDTRTDERRNVASSDTYAEREQRSLFPADAE